MLDTPLVTVVITTHNRCELLKRAIEGVKKQTYQNIQLIVVDDASEDGTQDFCRTGDFTYIRIEKTESKGGNYARNEGIKASKGTIIGFCDDDDYWLPEKLSRQLNLMKTSGCRYVHSGRRAEIISENGHVMYKDLKPSSDSRGDISKSILWNIHCLTSTLLVEKDLLEEVGLFDESLKAWQEHDLMIRLAQTGETDFISEPLIVYRVDSSDTNRLTNKYFGWRKSVDKILSKYKPFFNSLSYKEKLKVRRLISSDGIWRAQVSNLKWRWYYHRMVVKFCSTIVGK